MSLILVIAVLFYLMLGLGTSLHMRDFLELTHRPKSYLLGLFGQIMLLPLTCLLLCQVFSFDSYTTVGLLLVASCSGGASSNVLTLLVRGNVALSSALTLSSTMISIVTLPLIINFAMVHFVGKSTALALPIDKTMGQLLLTMAFPLALGMLLRRWPKISGWLLWSVKKTSLYFLIAMISLFVWENSSLLFAQAQLLIVPIVLLILLAGSSIAVFSRLLAVSPQDTRTLIVEVGIQNAAQAMTIALSPYLLNDSRFAAPAIVYALVMNLVFVGFALIFRLKLMSK